MTHLLRILVIVCVVTSAVVSGSPETPAFVSERKVVEIEGSDWILLLQRIRSPHGEPVSHIAVLFPPDAKVLISASLDETSSTGAERWRWDVECQRGGVEVDSGTFVLVEPTERGARFRTTAIGAFDSSDSSGITNRVLALFRMMTKRTAEPGATDNPDDAQRLREDH